MLASSFSCNIVEHLFDGVLTLVDGRVLAANNAALRLLGVSEPWQDSPLRQLTPAWEQILSAPATANPGRFHFWRQRVDPATGLSRRDVFVADTQWLPASAGSWDGTLVLRDASHVALLEKKLVNASYKDERTGLLTAVGFKELSRLRLAGRRRGQGLTTVLCISLPELARFKDAPVVYAEVLHDFALRVRESLRVNDLAAYLGNGQFAALVSDVPNLQLVHTVARRVGALVSSPFSFNGETVRLRAALGIALLGADGEAAEELLTAACASLGRAVAGSDEFFALAFANAELQAEAEAQAARAELLRQGVLQEQTRLAVSYFVGEAGSACLVAPQLGDFSEAEIWQAHEQHGLATALVNRMIGWASELAGDYFVFSFPRSLARVGQNGMTLLAAERGLPAERFFASHADDLPNEPGERVAAQWTGEVSLSSLRAREISLLLAPLAGGGDLLLAAEIELAKQFFKVFQGLPKGE